MRNFEIWVLFQNKIAETFYDLSITHKDEHFAEKLH
jgi:hypothetical protein